MVTYLKKSKSTAQQVRGRRMRKMGKKNPADTKVSHTRRGEGAAGARCLCSLEDTVKQKFLFGPWRASQ